MPVSFAATTRRGFGSFPLTLGPSGQVVRIVESLLAQRVDIRTVVVSTIPGLFTLKAPSISSVLPLWIFRGSSSDNLGNTVGIGIGVETDPVLGQQAMPSPQTIYPSLETLYLGYVSLQNVNGGTLRFPKGSLTARGGQFLAVVTTNEPVDLTLTPPNLYTSDITLAVLGTREHIGGTRRPSVAGKYLASLPRY